MNIELTVNKLEELLETFYFFKENEKRSSEEIKLRKLILKLQEQNTILRAEISKQDKTISDLKIDKVVGHLNNPNALR